MDLKDFEGVGPVRLEALRAMGILSLRDLLFTLPLRYEDHHSVSPCAVKDPGNVLVCGVFSDPVRSSYFKGISRVQGTISDASGRLSVTWFNEPWISKQIVPGVMVKLYGRLSVKNGRRILQNPKVVNDSGWVPVYRSVKHFPAGSFRKLIESALSHLDDCCPETLPRSFRIRNRLCELNFALREAHFPTSLQNLEYARRRLSFEQILLYLLYISLAGKVRSSAQPYHISERDITDYWNSLSFVPTDAQRKVLNDIACDLQQGRAMARMVQGDVGSGKTAVAFGAIYLSFKSGFQSSMMAPTEILAIQHYENAVKILEPLGIKCRLLTGSTGKKERKAVLDDLARGTCNAVFGTHALISGDVHFQKLGLVITDEQHRFGVNQRTALQNKGKTADLQHPHLLVMSATPIPRSLALILYGDLDISVINELPRGRKAVKTRIVPEAKREDLYRFLKDEARKGNQAYIVCPMVDDSGDADELRSAKSVYLSLMDTCLKDLRIALTWGTQKSAEKEQILKGFSEGLFDILVSTTVIEVGINNPNATIMIIENADRFGLSQLHQLRGRVGRGSADSWCFLFAEHSEKLDILCKTNDGFLISRKDLELRGPGDILGTRQSGEADNRFVFTGDTKLLEEVSGVVQKLRKDPEQAEDYEYLKNYADSYFMEAGRMVALN